jgi:hypothetical protein
LVRCFSGIHEAFGGIAAGVSPQVSTLKPKARFIFPNRLISSWFDLIKSRIDRSSGKSLRRPPLAL